MESLTTVDLAAVGAGGIACKPTEVDLERARDLSVDVLTIDFEGQDHGPAAALLQDLTDETAVRVTVPVRAREFDAAGPRRPSR